MVIDIIAVVCAAAAGAAQVSIINSELFHHLHIVLQPLMSLLFGNLTQDFVSFSLAENNYTASLQTGDPATIAQAKQILDTAAVGFRKSSALDASYLTYIGEFIVFRLNCC